MVFFFWCVRLCVCMRVRSTSAYVSVCVSCVCTSLCMYVCVCLYVFVYMYIQKFLLIQSWAEAPIKIARMTLTVKLDGNWSSFQLANSAPPLSVTDSAIAPSARIFI